MSDLFAAKRPDGLAAWRVLYERLARMAPGETVPHDELMARLETDDMGLVYRSVTRANKELEAVDRRAVAVVPGVGYRMLHASEHVGLADSHRKSAKRQIAAAKRALDGTRLGELTAEQRTLHHQVAIGFAFVGQVLDHHASRLASHDKLIHDLARRVSTLEGQPDSEVAS